MATLKTRIINKHGSYAEWASANPVLLEGEIALVTVTVAQNDAQGNVIHVPTVLMKVGDGASTFSTLKWMSAPASDVYAWAKKEDPAISELPSNLRTAIENLQSAVGSGGSVAESIDAALSAALGALDVEDAAETGKFVTAVSETDGKIKVTRAALVASDIPTLAISKIDGLQTALDAKATKTEFNTLNTSFSTFKTSTESNLATLTAADNTLQGNIDEVQDDLDAYKTSNNTAVANAKKAGDDAQTYAEGVATDLATLTTTVGNNKTDLEGKIGENTTLINSTKTALESADTAMAGRISTLENQVTTLNSATCFQGAGLESARPASGNKEGAIYVATDTSKEYIWDGNSWVELGDTTEETERISSLESKMTAAEGAIEDVETDISTNYAKKSELSSEVSTLNNSIATKLDTSTFNSFKSGDFKTAQDDITALDGRLDTAEGAINTLNGADTVTGSVKKTVKDAVATETTARTQAIAALSTTVDTKASQDDLDTLAGRVTTVEGKATTNANNITTANGKISALETRAGNIEKSIESEEDARSAADTALSGRLDAVETNYLKNDNGTLKVGTDTIIFDCGGPAD